MHWVWEKVVVNVRRFGVMCVDGFNPIAAVSAKQETMQTFKQFLCAPIAPQRGIWFQPLNRRLHTVNNTMHKLHVKIHGGLEAARRHKNSKCSYKQMDSERY